MSVQGEKAHGFIEWKINLLNEQFQRARYKEVFYSPSFKTVDGTIWKMEFCPKGYYSRNSCAVYLQCAKLIATKQRIGVNVFINIDEVDRIVDNGHTFTSGATWGRHHAFDSKKVNEFTSLTIKCFVWETMDFCDDNAFCKWKINNHLMQKCKQVLCSPKFKAVDAEWQIMLTRKQKQSSHIGIVCRSIANKNQLHFCHYISVETLNDNYCSVSFDDNSIKKDDTFPTNLPLQWSDIQKECEMTIAIKIWEKGSIHLANEPWIANIYQLYRKQTEKIIALKEKLNNCAMKEIKQFKSAAVLMKNEVAEKQNSFNEKLRMEGDQLGEWNIDSTKFIKIENELQGDQKPNTMQHLLPRYVDCKKLCDKQQDRMENVAAHCTKLNQIKKILKREDVQCTQMMNKTEQQHKEWTAEHEMIQKKRTLLQKQWKDGVKEMNETIDAENKINAAKCSIFDKYNVHKLEAKHWNELHTKCGELIKKYRLFDTQNDENIERVQRIFDELWNESMKCWFKWKPNDIICWLKYLQIEHRLILSTEFDFVSVMNEMVKSKMNGLSFRHIDKSDLKTVGIMALNDRQEIYHKINELTSKYPYVDLENQSLKPSVEQKSETSHIPNEFICPLTKQIMKEPVKIFDNHSYEKQAIVEYLKEHNKSPITGEECEDEDDHWTIPNRKLKEKIQIFLSVIIKREEESNMMNTRKRPLEPSNDDHLQQPSAKKIKREPQ